MERLAKLLQGCTENLQLLCVWLLFHLTLNGKHINYQRSTNREHSLSLEFPRFAFFFTFIIRMRNFILLFLPSTRARARTAHTMRMH
jgi:hypothetical protein